MSRTLVDKFGVTVGFYTGPHGAQMVQFEANGPACIVAMTREQFDEWQYDLLQATSEAEGAGPHSEQGAVSE
jgi:hypothetical protein